LKTKITNFGGIMNRGIFSVLIFFFCLTGALQAKNPAQLEIEKLLSSRGYLTKGTGIMIRDIDNDSIMVAVNGDSLFNPASVAKLVTAAAAYELLGSGYTFLTKIYIDKPFDADSGIVKGNLYIKGGADPGFTAERLWLLVQHLYHLGIRNIKGNLVLDDSFFDTVQTGPGFNEDSSSRAYESLINALSASFNTLAIHHRPGNGAGSPVYIDIFPKVRGVKIISSAKTVNGGSKANFDIITKMTNEGTSVVASGGRALDESPKYVYRKVWQARENFGGVIEALFDESGIGFKGKIAHDKVPQSLVNEPFYIFESEPLSHFINAMFKYSSNFAAEMLFKSISASLDSVPGSWAVSSEHVLSWWKQNDLPGTPVVKNGSGMGNTNRISPIQLTALLSHVAAHKEYFPEYLSALSISGADGTLKSRFQKSPLKGIVRGKTGTLNDLGVSTLAGYLLLPKHTYSFAIIFNRVGKGQYDNWMMQENVLEKFFSVIESR
jgi:D-alanyl-D-alanine carboxypeptidase/D-alanyl-D-alanine-endopeptidase (penicillin-binding protein 4)